MKRPYFILKKLICVGEIENFNVEGLYLTNKPQGSFKHKIFFFRFGLLSRRIHASFDITEMFAGFVLLWERIFDRFLFSSHHWDLLQRISINEIKLR